MEDRQSPLIDEIATALRKPLEDPYPFDTSGKPRAPNKFDKKLDETCRSGERNVLLDTGFQAWFAYIQAEPRAQLSFDQLPDSEARGVARYLCTIQPHPTVELLFQHILYEAFRAVPRRSQLQASNYHNFPAARNVAPLGGTSPTSAASVQPQDIDEPQSVKNDARRNHVEQEQGNSSLREATSGQLQTASEPQPMVDHRRRSSAEQQSTPNTNSHPNTSTLDTMTHKAVQPPRLAPSTNAFDQDLRRLPPPRGCAPDMAELPPAGEIIGDNMANNSWSFPKARNILSLLPNLTCFSVVKSDSLATIRIIFGDAPSQCHLEIDVYAQKIPYIARELFGLTFDVEDGRLTMRATESCANMTFEKVTLSGADLNGCEKVFGKVFQIIKEDPLYEDEIENGMPVTNLVSLDIRGKIGDPSCLKIRSTAQTMAIIAKRLWPQYPFSS